MSPKALPHMILRGSTWAAKVRVPAPLVPVLGRSVFVRSTEETDLATAFAKAQPWVRDWKRQIADAKSGKQMGVAQKVEAARAKVRRILSKSAPGEDAEAWEAVEALFDSLGVTLPPTTEGAIVDQVMGRATPFGSRVDAWGEQLHMGDRERSMYLSDVRAFDKAHPGQSVEDMEGATVQAWIEGLGLAPKTVERKLSALRNYWGYLQAHGIAKETARPFHGRRLPKNGGREKRKGFTLADVVALEAAARERGDAALANLIRLGAYTGARIEELCQLTTGHVSAGVLTIPGTKTDAAARTVPVHSAIAGLVEALGASAGPGGYLVPSTAENRYGERSAALSKRFGRLKEGMGFGPAHVFHSIRKTVATILEDMGCPEGVAADILGHDKPTMTYGLYSGGASIATKREWLEKIAYPDSVS